MFARSFALKALFTASAFALAAPLAADDHEMDTGEEMAGPEKHFTAEDIFGLSVAADPQISPDGSQIAYVRRTNDIMTDRAVSSIWLIDVSTGDETPLVTGAGTHVSPRWSPDGDRLAYISTESGGGPELHVRWMDTGESANITALAEGPRGIAWSPDGTQIAYTARVPGKGLTLGTPPAKPEGAEWGKSLQVIDRLVYRRDGGSYVKPGTAQLFVVSATGGAPRQLTFGEYSNGGSVEWSPDGAKLYFSANRREDWELEIYGSEIYALDIASGDITALTTRNGPDGAPQVSPDGSKIAYLGRDDNGNAFDQTKLYVMNADGSGSRELVPGFDRGFDGIEWTDAGLFASYEDDGEHRVARIGLNAAAPSPLNARIGSTYYALPYTGGEWSVSDNGALAFTTRSAVAPPDVGVETRRGVRTLTSLNGVSLAGKEMGETRELSVTMDDGTVIPAWIMLPPGYEAGDRVPAILEMHGGPYAAYGPEFSVDYQLYGAAGYAVIFSNPGGSTGYGEEFADRIEDNYPISNFPELMKVVDAAVAQGFADPENLFVTGGSGGGILTAYLVGKTDRFKAAAAHKPVINWVSQGLMSDLPTLIPRYWMGGLPWEKPEEYWERGPLSNMANVVTPTLVLVGAEDYRTPRSEAEQFYAALKLVGVDTALVVTPDSSHNNLSQSPSQQVARTNSVIAWFDKYRTDKEAE
ncbi:S9 family peptidase [Erythrobacter sp. SCSIO 43205]|uniref:alpha/beta hydrolase family protein n=1 Tax=Erythrobacter sp. SCSIO 43205 TaxID=2779361 RepID=UPI001CA8A538|nr:S9 family peptidase [Erythrobacter sp. SCSIO 43205]UAB78500.1 S9 family peptidase [Erythrobacter sp. SCSIO 43205]